jgi:hypothetical protein
MVSLENFLNKNIYIKIIAHCYSGVLTVTLVSLIMTFTVTYWKELIVLLLSGFVIGYLLTIGSIAEANCLWDTLVSVFILGVTILLTVLGSEVTGLPLWGYMALTGACAMLEYKLEQWVSNLTLSGRSVTFVTLDFADFSCSYFWADLPDFFFYFFICPFSFQTYKRFSPRPNTF